MRRKTKNKIKRFGKGLKAGVILTGRGLKKAGKKWYEFQNSEQAKNMEKWSKNMVDELLK
jgi:hypothetical protein